MLDRHAQGALRTRRAIQQLAFFGQADGVSIGFGTQESYHVLLGSNGGLQLAGGGVSIKVTSNAGLALGASGIGAVVVAPIIFSAGAIGLNLETNGGLALFSSQLGVSVDGTTITINGSGQLTAVAAGVTSVGLALPASTFSISGSPVTSTGTLTGSFTTQLANTFLAGPVVGAPATPTWRALSSADIPYLVVTKGDLLTNNGATPVRLPVGANGTILTADSTQPDGIAWEAPAAGNPFVGKNRLINGNFDFWQRWTGVSFTTNGQYTADRWKLNTFGTGGAGGVIQFSMNGSGVGVNLTGTPNRANVTSVWGLEWSQTVAASTNPILEQRIEDPYVFAGQTLSVSFAAAQTTGATKTLKVQVFQSNTSTTTVLGTVTLTTTWATYAVSGTLPNNRGNGAGYVAIQFLYPTGETFISFIAQVQAEPGAVATEFEYRPFGVEFALCQRYYERSYSLGQATGLGSSLGPCIAPQVISSLAGSTAGNVGNCGQLGFRVEKPATPTVVLYGFAGTANSVRINSSTGTNADRGGCTVGTMTPGGELQFVTFDASGATAIAAGNCLFAHWTAESEI